MGVRTEIATELTAMSWIDDLKQKFDERCLVSNNRINKEGCRLTLEWGLITQNLIVDLDKPGSPFVENEKKCDYILAFICKQGSGWLAPLELMKGRLDASKALDQLNAGVSKVERLIPQSVSINLYPIVASGYVKRQELRKLRKQPVKFRLEKEVTESIRCGSKLHFGALSGP